MAAEKPSRASHLDSIFTHFQTAGKIKALRPLRLRNFQFYQASQPSKAAITAVPFSWLTHPALILLVKYTGVPTFYTLFYFQPLCTKDFWSPFAAILQAATTSLTHLSSAHRLPSWWNCPSCLQIILSLFIETICLNSLGPSKSPVSYV